MTFKSRVYASMDLPKKKLRNTTWGVFKAYVVFWCINLDGFQVWWLFVHFIQLLSISRKVRRGLTKYWGSKVHLVVLSEFSESVERILLRSIATLTQSLWLIWCIWEMLGENAWNCHSFVIWNSQTTLNSKRNYMLCSWASNQYVGGGGSRTPHILSTCLKTMCIVSFGVECNNVVQVIIFQKILQTVLDPFLDVLPPLPTHNKCQWLDDIMMSPSNHNISMISLGWSIKDQYIKQTYHL